MGQFSDRKSRLPLAAVAALLVWAGCERLNGLEGKLEHAVRSSANSGQVLRMEDVTDFPWDELHVFSPYTAADDMQRQLGFIWLDARDVERDDVNLLVFVRNRKVVQSLHFPRAKGDFVPVPNSRYLRAEAQFRVEAPAKGFVRLTPLSKSPGEQAPRDGGSR